MASPLQSRSYELMIRVASADMENGGDWRTQRVYEAMFASAMELGSAMEDAACSSDRFEFRLHLHEVHTCLRQVKLWLRVLDDLGHIAPEVASPLHDAAEEVHRLVIAALTTSKTVENTSSLKLKASSPASQIP